MISSFIVWVSNAYVLLIFIYVIMSWLPGTMDNGPVGQIYRALGVLCEPYLGLFRRFIPPIGGMVDISPIVAVIVLQLIVRFIVIIL